MGETKVTIRSTGYLPTLDGWRALAVFMVVFSHAIGLVLPSFETRWHAGEYGVVGVQIFFGISGYLICSRLLEEWRVTKSISIAGFYIRRAFRIMPPAFVYLGVVGILGLLGIIPMTFQEMIGSLAFVRNYYPPTGGYYTAHYWSLAVEEHFYLFFPVVLLLSGRRRVVWVLLGLAILTMVHRYADKRWHYSSDVFPGMGSKFHTDHCLDGLLLGAIAAVLAARYPSFFRGRFGFVAGAMSAVVVCTATGAFATPILPVTAKSVLVAVMLAGTVHHPRSLLGRVLELQPVRYIGWLSYSIYLWQQLFFVWRPVNYAPRLIPIQFLPWNLAALLVCAIASYYLIERPMIRLGHRLAKPVTPGRSG